MTRIEIENERASINTAARALSNEAIRAIDALEATTSELAVANTTIERLVEELRVANLPQPPVGTESVTMPISTSFARQPRDINIEASVRFLSKNSSGGLANIRAAMNDAGINAKRLKLEGSTYTPNNDTLIINWGGGFTIPSNLSRFTGRYLNKLDAVKIAANKLKTFKTLHEDTFLKDFIPEFKITAGDALAASWDKTYVRETLYGHSGEGIQVIQNNSGIPSGHPLYVEGLNIKHEYRVHVVNGFTKVQKKAKLETPTPNMDVRNLEGGWTFINEFTLGDRGREELHELSTKVITCLGLDFGAVDLIRTQANTWKVLEVNTAPGVSSESNIAWYTKALLSI